MCLVLPSRVLAVLGGQAEVELADGQRMLVNAELKPDLAVGDYVLIDRGLIIETIDADEAQAIIEIYAAMGAMADAQDPLDSPLAAELTIGTAGPLDGEGAFAC